MFGVRIQEYREFFTIRRREKDIEEKRNDTNGWTMLWNNEGSTTDYLFNRPITYLGRLGLYTYVTYKLTVLLIICEPDAVDI